MFRDTLPNPPDALTALGYTREEGPPDEWGAGVRKVWFQQRVAAPEAELRFEVIIQFELATGDDPDASWEENCSYHFEEVRLNVFRVPARDDADDDTPPESPAAVGSHVLRPPSLADLDAFLVVLGHRRP